ncbi:hypothetical protein [Burkholderia sp. Tr-20390]|uniref:hypothetical protein n=1 Tax=Burkholderia sp. Tr-20390 TaxID=2703904 RepID=UPI0019819248|nr:hypothetical protein [Burkholderia sp. Tr-20390]MBN3735945.1 hypothetical protein [Burkholderia sp. Tr-20390]
MIPAKAHSPPSRIIHSVLFAVRRFSVNDGQTRSPRRSSLPGARFRRFFPGIFFRFTQCECVIFSEMPALPFSFPGNGPNDYKSKLK